jgi:ATP-dependent Lhr-like helicase
MARLLRELESEGRVQQIALAGTNEPQRWVLTEEAERYRTVFDSAPTPRDDAQDAATTILRRYLETHALVGLADVLARYPFERRWAQRQLEEWSQTGRVVPVPPVQAPEPLQWSLPENLEQVRRGTLAIQRREVITCPAPQFADFVARWQFVHPATRRVGPNALNDVLARLKAVPLPASLWGHAILPARLPNYEPRWLDELIGSGGWTWTMRGDDLTLLERDLVGQFPPTEGDPPLEPAAEAVLNLLEQRGALYTAEIAGHLRVADGAVRAALWTLQKRGLATNDRFDVARRSEPPVEAEPRFRSNREVTAFLRRSTHRPERAVSEGRWSRLAWGGQDVEARAVLYAGILLNRFGVVSREMAALDPAAPAWRILYEVFSRMELTGDVRRGYFVEGLSGAQFAVAEAARLLQELSAPAHTQPPLLLLHSLDPANLYGSGAPFDLALLSGGERLFHRRSGNWLVLRAGKPVLLIEQHGKRLTALPSTAGDEIVRAVALLPSIMPGSDAPHKLVVETWNEHPVTASEGKELLEQAGFVRDYQAMTLYATWQ